MNGGADGCAVSDESGMSVCVDGDCAWAGDAWVERGVCGVRLQ